MLDATPAFEVRGVAKRYGARVALAPLDLRVERGESVAIVGPSGSGKTTLLNLLGGAVEPDAGEVRVLGAPLSGLSRRDRAARVGMMRQQFDLVPHLSVVHNVLAGNLGRWGLGTALWSLIRPVGIEDAEAALARVGLPGRLHERTAHLSGGEQQRVALARLLVQRPHALLADEPVSSLDPARAEALVALLVRMAHEGGHTLVASLHTVQLAVDHFSRIIALREGHLVFDRPSAEVTREELAELYAIEAADVASGTRTP
ncbi:MAG: phosphonate ABC transporter ATP-binding protein [Dehalococcoidia bacterium]